MVVLDTRELTHAMSVIGISSSSHPIGILMSGAGRFVVCIDCRRRLSFPAGTHFDTIAKEFESHLCGSSCAPKDEDISAKTFEASDPNLLSRHDFDRNATPMWVFDLNTFSFSDVNDAAVDHYGYSRNEFLSMTLLDIYPSDGIVSLLRDVLRQGRHNTAKELRKHKKKDGTLIDVEVTRYQTIFNGCIADIVTAVDLTGRRLTLGSNAGKQEPPDPCSRGGPTTLNNDLPSTRLRSAWWRW